MNNHLKHYALFVMLLCYLPHILTGPLWIFLIFISAIAYRLMADYYLYPPIPLWIRFVIVMGCLFLLNADIYTNQFLIRFLLVFIILKCCLELHSTRDLKVLIICNFFLMFSALIVIQEVWMIIYLLIALLANFSIMLKMNAPESSLRQIISKTSQQVIIVIPISLLLFFVFPRIDPLWQVPRGLNSTVGFTESLNFGSIAEVFNDNSTVMQITFTKAPIFQGYWRGIILTYFSGETWNSSRYSFFDFSHLPEIKPNEVADYEILLEPNQTKWLFYSGYPLNSKPKLLFSPEHGIIYLDKKNLTQRFAYSIQVGPAPYHILNPNERAETTQLPPDSNPRLNNWAKSQFAKTQNNIPDFIAFLKNYIHQQPFWYTLAPPVLDENKNPMDTFWFKTQKGFCEHYVSAVAFILRSAGIPTRVIIGYYGGHWNPVAHTIVVQRNNAHAWLEYWQEGVGWQQLDPTAFITPERIDQTIRNQTDIFNEHNYFNSAALPWMKKIKFYIESIRFFSERWLLFYNQNTQQNLMKQIGFAKLTKDQLLQVSIFCVVIFFSLFAFLLRWRQRLIQDALLHEYHLLQKEFQRFNISTYPSATLKQQCHSLINQVPELNAMISSFIHRYELLRLKQSKGNKKETIKLFKTLRSSLCRRNRRLTH